MSKGASADPSKANSEAEAPSSPEDEESAGRAEKLKVVSVSSMTTLRSLKGSLRSLKWCSAEKFMSGSKAAWAVLGQC